MRWLCVTLGLLATCVCLVAWIYLRDRNTNWQPPEPQLARVDATAVLTKLTDGYCRSGCAAEVLGHTRSHRWLVRITVRGQPQCLQIDLDTFATSRQHGLSGVQPSHCTTDGR
jgi:hypothetical protein